MKIQQRKGDRPPKPVPPQRASALLSACAIQEGWFYARAIGEVLGARCELGEMIWLSFQHPDVLEIQREWCKIFCFRWHREDEAEPHHEAARWNAEHPVGTVVALTEDDGSITTTITRSEAWHLGHGEPVVKVAGRAGGYMLARIRPCTRSGSGRRG